MTMRRLLIAGNWKMNGLRHSADRLVSALVGKFEAVSPEIDVVLCPPTTLLTTVGDLITGTGLMVGGQDCHFETSGAHTGEISAQMLRDAGCSHVILGHSERRADQHEGDALIRSKAEAAIAAGLTVILCVGETLEQRRSGQAEAVVAAQLAGSLPRTATPENVVVAYEPVWAIGTGLSARPYDVQAMHAGLRRMLGKDMAGAQAVRLLYGGSVKPANVSELLAVPEVDGALVGGASLDADEFWSIVKAAQAQAQMAGELQIGRAVPP